MRHAKSDWSASYSGDRERPLNDRGVGAAKRVGRWLSTVGKQPDLIVSSPAVRALTTAELAAEAGSWTAEIQVDARLYEGGVGAVTEALRELPDDVGCALVAGHLPTWPALVATLSGGDLRMPTAAVACLRLRSSWSQLSPGSAELVWLVTPKLLAKSGF